MQACPPNGVLLFSSFFPPFSFFLSPLISGSLPESPSANCFSLPHFFLILTFPSPLVSINIEPDCFAPYVLTRINGFSPCLSCHFESRFHLLRLTHDSRSLLARPLISPDWGTSEVSWEDHLHYSCLSRRSFCLSGIMDHSADGRLQKLQMVSNILSGSSPFLLLC